MDYYNNHDGQCCGDGRTFGRYMESDVDGLMYTNGVQDDSQMKAFADAATRRWAEYRSRSRDNLLKEEKIKEVRYSHESRLIEASKLLIALRRSAARLPKAQMHLKLCSNRQPRTTGATKFTASTR